MFSTIAIILSIVAAVRSKEVNIQFTKVSYTIAGTQCLSDCVNDRCFVDWRLNEMKCIDGEEAAPTYFTSQTHKSLTPTCLSACGKFGYSYNWCFIDQEFNWDYCNPNVEIKWVSHQNTLYYGPCSDACKLSDGAYQCTNFHGHRSECNPRKNHTFVQAKTTYGDDCVGMCKKHNGEVNKYYWCEDKNQKNQYCAPPAQPRTLSSFSCIGKIHSGDCAKISSKTKRCITNFKHSAVVEAANKMEKSSYFKTVRLQEERNPVHSYTVKLPNELGEATLPLVIKATVTAENIRPIIREAKSKAMSESVRKNLAKIATMPGDEAKQLVGFLIGGTNSVFNVVPQRMEVRLKITKFEKEIYDWVTIEGDNTVEMTIVVMYDTSSRPNAIGIDMVFYKLGKVVKMHRDEILHNLEKGQEQFIIEPKKVYVKQVPEIPIEDIDIGLW